MEEDNNNNQQNNDLSQQMQELKSMFEELKQFKAQSQQQQIEEPKGLKDIYKEDTKKTAAEEELEELRKYKTDIETVKAVNEVVDILSDKGLPTNSTIAKSLLGADNDSTLANVKNFEKIYKKAVADGVQKALKENGFEPPKKSNSNTEKYEGKTSKELADLWARGEITTSEYDSLMKKLN